MVDLNKMFPPPPGERPRAPEHHNPESPVCSLGWSSTNPAGEPVWLDCDCEDPSNPWPARKITDGPVDCDCYYCFGQNRQERGRAPCENENHHCKACHERSICTVVECGFSDQWKTNGPHS